VNSVNINENRPEFSVLEASFIPLNDELNPICHLLALLGAHHILHVSRIRVKHQRRTFSKKTRLHKYGEIKKTARIMMATVGHVTFGAGRTKFQTAWFFFGPECTFLVSKDPQTLETTFIRLYLTLLAKYGIHTKIQCLLQMSRFKVARVNTRWHNTTISLGVLISVTCHSYAHRNFLFRDIDGDFFRMTQDTAFTTSSHLISGANSSIVR
jgi:hypothetical protein